MPNLEDTAEPQGTGIFSRAYDDDDDFCNSHFDAQDVGAEADFNNMEPSIIERSKISVQTRRVDHAEGDRLESFINKQRRTNHKDFQNCLFACFLSQDEPKKITQALDDESWVEAMQEELLQFKLLNVDTGGFTSLKESHCMVNYMGFHWSPDRCKEWHTYMAILQEEFYVHQPPGFVDLEFPNKVYKVEKALYGLHQAPRVWYETLLNYLLENGFRRGTIDKTLFIKKIKNDILLVKQRKDGIFLSQDKYVYDILKKFGFSSMKAASTPMETHKSLATNAAEPDVNVHLYRYMIGSLMYLTSSWPDIMFAVCACSRFQVTPKASHMHAVKRIFRYLKGQPTLGLWYPKDSPLDLIAYSDSDYAGASIDRKSTTGGCQFLGCRLILWKCKKQTIVANLTTKAEYIAASNCCGQVLWLQNQLLDYGYNFLKTKIHIDNESTINVIKNPVAHSKTKHIEIRFHFIRDSYEKRLIEMVKIHTDYNVADLHTKAFDVTRFQFLITSIVAYMGFCNKHNMVAFLQKPAKSKEFHQMVDFLAGSHIRYALTTNPTIYVSIVEQFWQTATVKTINDGEQQITVTFDEHNFAITKASVRRHLELADVDGGYTPGSIKGSMKLIELTDLCTKLVDRVTSLEIELTKTKQIYGKAITKLAKKVKHLEDKLKSTKTRRKARIVLLDEEEDLVSEAPSKQGKMEESKVEGVQEERQEDEYHFDQTLLQ
ncbi:putative ribonuclease H-like domain-containing protein [Tanacetum coccineum]|uniref:Ribonuclease H-like domain-containing protein n=1 Tax=Tanacetum coccineum TaxID=301880 RepID=A0ABQ5DU16_9ASTR